MPGGGRRRGRAEAQGGQQIPYRHHGKAPHCEEINYKTTFFSAFLSAFLFHSFFSITPAAFSGAACDASAPSDIGISAGERVTCSGRGGTLGSWQCDCWPAGITRTSGRGGSEISFPRPPSRHRPCLLANINNSEGQQAAQEYPWLHNTNI